MNDKLYMSFCRESYDLVEQARTLNEKLMGNKIALNNYSKESYVMTSMASYYRENKKLSESQKNYLRSIINKIKGEV